MAVEPAKGRKSWWEVGGGWVGGPTKLWPDTPGDAEQQGQNQLKPSRAPVKRRMGCNISTHAPGMRLPHLGMQAQTSQSTHPGRGGASVPAGAGKGQVGQEAFGCKGNSAERKVEVRGPRRSGSTSGGGQGIRQGAGGPPLPLCHSWRAGEGGLEGSAFWHPELASLRRPGLAWALGHCPHSGGGSRLLSGSCLPQALREPGVRTAATRDSMTHRGHVRALWAPRGKGRAASC